MKIPEFTALEEIAEIWDNYGIIDFKDELTEVTQPIFHEYTKAGGYIVHNSKKREVDQLHPNVPSKW